MKENGLGYYCAYGIINELVNLVLKEHPSILAEAISNFFNDYPEVKALASDIAKDIQKLAKEKLGAERE